MRNCAQRWLGAAHTLDTSSNTLAARQSGSGGTSFGRRNFGKKLVQPTSGCAVFDRAPVVAKANMFSIRGDNSFVSNR